MILRLTFLTLALAVSTVAVTSKTGADNPVPPLEQLLKLQADGNQKDAYDGLRRFVLEKKDTSSADLVKAFNAAVTCLPALNRSDELDEFREKAVAAHKKDWLLLMAVGHSYLSFDHFGYIIAGEFSRGPHRGAGKAVPPTPRPPVPPPQLFSHPLTLPQPANP